MATTPSAESRNAACTAASARVNEGTPCETSTQLSNSSCDHSPNNESRTPQCGTFIEVLVLNLIHSSRSQCILILSRIISTSHRQCRLCSSQPHHQQRVICHHVSFTQLKCLALTPDSPTNYQLLPLSTLSSPTTSTPSHRASGATLFAFHPRSKTPSSSHS